MFKIAKIINPTKEAVDSLVMLRAELHKSVEQQEKAIRPKLIGWPQRLLARHLRVAYVYVFSFCNNINKI